MVQAKCIQKFRNKQGQIVGYQLQDTNGNKMLVQPYQLKNAIRQNKINIVNLTLTSDNRLMDSNTKKKQEKDNKLNIQTVAKAMVEIEKSTLGMGDSYLEIVENVCCHADILDDVYDLLEEELEKAHVKAYVKIFGDKDKLVDVFTEYLEYYYEERGDEMCRQLIYYDRDTPNNTLLSSINIMYEFGKLLVSKNILTQEQFKYMDALHKKINSVDIPLCSLGSKIAYTFYKYLDEKYFLRTNSAFTLGYVTVDEDDEKHIGAYIMRGETRDSKHTKWTVGLNRDGKGIKLDIYKWLHEGDLDDIPNFQFIQSIKPNTTDVNTISKMVASTLNKLAAEASRK